MSTINANCLIWNTKFTDPGVCISEIPLYFVIHYTCHGGKIAISVQWKPAYRGRRVSGQKFGNLLFSL